MVSLIIQHGGKLTDISDNNLKTNYENWLVENPLKT